MSSKNHAKLINATALYRPGDSDLRFRVIILDVRPSFGRTDVLIGPVSGHGAKWVDKDGLLDLKLVNRD
jgi:hypothetical protein